MSASKEWKSADDARPKTEDILANEAEFKCIRPVVRGNVLYGTCPAHGVVGGTGKHGVEPVHRLPLHDDS